MAKDRVLYVRCSDDFKIRVARYAQHLSKQNKRPFSIAKAALLLMEQGLIHVERKTNDD